MQLVVQAAHRTTAAAGKAAQTGWSKAVDGARVLAALRVPLATLSRMLSRRTAPPDPAQQSAGHTLSCWQRGALAWTPHADGHPSCVDARQSRQPLHATTANPASNGLVSQQHLVYLPPSETTRETCVVDGAVLPLNFSTSGPPHRFT